ncbi:Pentatricopeptide repeat-containing protein At5g55740, chloroplastic [Linum perenne]
MSRQNSEANRNAHTIFTSDSMASLPLTTSINPNPDSHKFNPTNNSRNIRRTLLIKPSTGTRRDGYRSYFYSISFLSRQGRVQEAMRLLNDMELKSYLPGQEIYSELLQGCISKRDVWMGQQIHARIVKNGALFTANEYIETKLVIFYAKCDLLIAADRLFARLRAENVFSWAAIIGLHSRIGDNVAAVMGLCKMVENGFSVDNFVVPNVLKACGGLQWVGCGRGVHGLSMKMGLDACVFVSSSLVDMYGKCGVLEDARKVFDGMADRNVVTWNSMIFGYAQNGFSEEAIDMFLQMRLEDYEPTDVTLLSLLSASANLGAIEEGKQGHCLAVSCGFELDKIMGSSILNFYSKVGLIEDAELVFSKMLDKDEVTWNLLISCYVRLLEVDKALNMCHLMRSENLRFDSVTLASILAVCSHTRNVMLGKEAHCYCVRNNLYSDVVVASNIMDMYAKCQRIGEASRVFESTVNTNTFFWNTLLTAYVESGHIGEALRLFYQMQLNSVPQDVTSWNSVIMGCLRNGDLDEAKYMFSKMQSAES